jgi:Tripartite tricarboxylate transporter TctB family
MRRDVIIAIGLIGLAGLYWIGADNISESILGGGVGSDALPKLLAATLAALSGILILQTLAKRRQAAAADQPSDAERHEQRRLHLRAAGMLAIGASYVVLVETIGYMPAIGLLLAAVVSYVGGASWRQVALFAIIGGVLFWAFFVWFLGIREPPGPWLELWRSIAG